MSTTEEALLERMKLIAAAEKDSLEDGSFRPRFLWYDDPDAPPRVIMLPTIDGTTHPQVAWAVKILSVTQENISELVFIMDSWRTSQSKKSDGTSWGRGEMQYAVEHQTVDAQFVFEALTLTIAYPDGNFAMSNLPYKRLADGSVEYDWDPDKMHVFVTNESEGSPGGFFPDAMQEALVTTKMTDLMLEQFGSEITEIVEEGFGLEKWQADMHVLCVGIKMVLVNVQFPCWVMARSDEEAELLEHSMKNGPFSEQVGYFTGEQVQEIENLEKAYAMSDPDS